MATKKVLRRKQKGMEVQTVQAMLPPKLIVRVSQQEIDTAVPKDSNRCMIADAVRRTVIEKFGFVPTHVSVDATLVRFSDPAKGLRHHYLTPRVAKRAIYQFDLGRKPSPFRMSLQPMQSTKMTGITQAEKKRRAEARAAVLKGKAKNGTIAKRKKEVALINAQNKEVNNILNGPGVLVTKEESRKTHTGPKTYVKGVVGGPAPHKGSRKMRQFGERALGDMYGPTQDIPEMPLSAVEKMKSTLSKKKEAKKVDNK